MIHHIHTTHPLKEAMNPVGRLARRARCQRGQALLVAVLIMMAILLIGALFVAIVNYNQESSTRHSDMVAAQGLAEAGIRYADYMLQYSPEGADWRPPFVAGTEPPVVDNNGNYSPRVSGPDTVLYTDDDYYTDQEVQHGWCPVVDAVSGEYIRFGFTRYPDPFDLSGDLNINRGHFLLRVTYDPDPPYEPNDPQYGQPSPVPDPLSRYIRIESIGVVDDVGFVFRRLVAYKPLALTDYLLFVTDRTRRAQPTILGYNPAIDMDHSGALGTFSPSYSYITGATGDRYTWHGPMRFNTPVQLEGGPALNFVSVTHAVDRDATPPDEAPGQPEGGGYLRDDQFESAYTVDDSGILCPSVPVSEGADGVRRLTAPDLFAEDPATGTMRWYALTRDSGVVVLNPNDGNSYNVGQFGHGRGIYIDNFTDLQFVNPQGRQDIPTLIQDWLHNLPDGAVDSGWNDVGEVYDLPPGVEIELFPTEATVLEWASLTGLNGGPPIADASLAGTIPVDQLWWPGYVSGSGEPGILLVRHDDTWRYGDPNQAGRTGNDSGTRTMCLNYPLPGHQVIFAEGNIRIKGRLPRPATANAGDGGYNLTVVSGGTIYIDGQLLSPQDQWGRQVTGGSLPGGIVSDQDNTYIALLARDCVVVNPTMLVPQTPAPATMNAADDAFGRHWVAVGGTPSVDSQWYWGAPPVPGSTANLVVRQTRNNTPAIPAPEYVAAATMNIYNGQTSITSPYFFDTAGIAWDDSTKFVLASPLAWLPGVDGSIGVPPDYQVPRQWAPNVRPPAWVELADTSGWAATPWDLSTLSYVSTAAGILNGLYVSPLLPGDTFFNPFTAFAYTPTPYWLKKFKIEELSGGAPVGAIHAKINAIMYAERGCFFVIPAPYFYEDATSQIPRFLRYNYDIEIRGAITENFHPGPAAVREWQEKWAWPVGGGSAAWNSIRYVYDETILAARHQAPTELAGTRRQTGAAYGVVPTNAANLPKHPLLPVSPDLLYGQ